jgi:hypothetical protein
VEAAAWSTDPDRFLHWDRLGISISLLNVLVASGSFVTQSDEFAELHVGLVASSCVLQNSFRALPQTIGALCLPLQPCNYSSAHKLNLVLELHRQGWDGQHAAVDMAAGSPKAFSLSIVSGSATYFRALLESEQLFARGLPSILCSRPHGYYRCLLELPDFGPLLAIEDGVLQTMTNAHFMSLLRGQVPDLNDAQLALEDAPAHLALDDGVEGPVVVHHLALGPPRVEEVIGPLAAGVDEFDELQTVQL